MNGEISVNERAFSLLSRMLDDPDYYRVTVAKTESDATLIDAGVAAEGGFEAGRLITEVCMGGCASVQLTSKDFGGLELPCVLVYSDHPVIATLGSQYAGWQIRENGYFAIGSGPARALAQKPQKIFESIRYRDDFTKAIMILEADKSPSTSLMKRFASDCHVSPKNLFIILTPTTSVAGAVQISGRIIETGIQKLRRLGFDPNAIVSASGSAPIPPSHPDFDEAMGRTNDALIYGGSAYYQVRHDDDARLAEIVENASSTKSSIYGKRFLEIFRLADGDFYKIDPNFFAPAVVAMTNLKTGKIHLQGRTDAELLRRSFGFS